MKKLLVMALVVGVCCLLAVAPALAKDEKVEAEKAEKAEVKKAEVPAGQQVFMKAKCSMCHTVFSAGIGEEPKTDEEKEKAADGPPDLSFTATGRTAEWLTGFLQKKEKLNDKLHMMPFKGSEEDLKSLVGWMLTLKAPEEDEKAEKATESAKADENGDHQKDEAHEDSEHDHGSQDKSADTDAKKGD